MEFQVVFTANIHTRVFAAARFLREKSLSRGDRERKHATKNICQMDFVNKPLLTGELKEVPGLGEVGINTLNHSGIFTTYQLIGKFLEVRKGGSNRA